MPEGEEKNKTSKQYTEESLNRLNLSIDAKVMLKKLNYRSEAMEILEDKLRAFCPIHKDKNFRTLVIDLKNNHFKCHFFQCEGAKGGSLLHLYSLVNKCTIGESADFWGKELNVPIEEIKTGEDEGMAVTAEEKQDTEKSEKSEKITTENRFTKGVSLYTRNLLADAIKEFEFARKEDSGKELQVHNMLGLCYMKQGSYEKAIEEFKNGLGCKGYEEKEYLGLKYNLGRVYETTGKNDDAMKTFKEIEQKDPKYQDVAQRLKKLETAAGSPTPRKIKISYV